MQHYTSTSKSANGGKPRTKSGKRGKRKSTRAKKTAGDAEARTRTAKPYPASSFTNALPLGEAIMNFASGDKVRRLTLLEKMNKSPNSGPTKMMITNSGKYGITKGSYAAEYLELTEKGRIVVDTQKSDRERRQAAFVWISETV